METNQHKNEKVRLLQTLFSGNPSAYGLETPDGPVSVREPITDEILLDHIEGKKRIGCFLIQKDNKVKTSCIDLDQGDRQKLERIVAALINNGFFPYIERSKSKGYHVWIFFDEPILAATIRKVLSQIMKRTGIEGIEIFPKQDLVNSNNGLGNYVFFPLQGQSIKQGGTLFLKSNLEPYEDQWDYLSKVHKTKVENILSLYKAIPAEPEEKSDPTSEVNVNIPAYLKHYHISFTIKKQGTRTLFNLERCPFDGEHTKPDKAWQPAIIQGQNGKITYYCFHAHCATRTWADIRQVISGQDSLAKFCKGYIQPTADLKAPVTDRGLPKGLFQIIDEPEEKEEIPLIENLLYPGDKGFVVSMYKLGKTLFMMQMALCLSMGIRFLGLFIPLARKVLYLRFELKDARFKKRLNIMLPALGGREKVQVTPFFHMVRGFDIKNEKDFSWLLDLIYKFEPEVLFLDPFYKLSLSTDLRKDDGSGIIRRFDNLMGRFPDLNVSIAHHLRKQSGGIKDDSWDSAYGPMQLFADMDYEIRISRKGNQKDTFIFSHISNDVTIDNFTFKRNPTNLLYELETTEDIQNQWLRDCDKVVSQVQNGVNKKGNLKTWIEENLKYSQRDSKDFLNFLLDQKKLLWVGNKTRGNFEAPNLEKEGNGYVQDSFQSFQSGD